mgnify:CR=1 FL=1
MYIRSITLGDQDEVIHEETVVRKLSELSEGLGGACKMTEESAIIVVVMPTTFPQTEATHN